MYKQNTKIGVYECDGYEVFRFAMRKTVLFIMFLTSGFLGMAQVSLYGQYVFGDTREAVNKYDRSLRLNGMYYYIEPHFDSENKLYQVKIINYDYVLLQDYAVVRNHAERLVDLMQFKFGKPSKLQLEKQPIRCGIDTPYLIAYWENDQKTVQIDIECKDERYLHLALTIKAGQSLDQDDRPILELAEF